MNPSAACQPHPGYATNTSAAPLPQSLAHIQNGVMTVQGEKKLEREEEKENYHVMERRYGSFQRSLRIPDTADEERIEARFDKGVLKVILPKRAEAASEQRKIEIKKS